jgi:hypothetical protein
MPPPKYKTFKIPQGGISYVITMANGDEAVTLATETSLHDDKLVEIADPSKGNSLSMTTARTAAATRISIALPTTVMTKGKAPATMTMIQLHIEQRESITVIETHPRTSRAKDMTLHHPLQASPTAAVVVAAQLGHVAPEKIRKIISPTMRVPT